ncbi:RNA-binding protein NOB1-like isoform X3 [Portunus trituberculatus]|uniref:RNA-binding protein NOB1-like isoform X3 n=1 Tax=Portunus trituberculatus TaxID=210409 RepID=UPI001E1CBB52|nr:RNA-binding protein NOB1-like isoform X3 [Portunus trituberculatus]
MKPQYLVVDTAALVKYVPLWEYGEQLYSVPEIISEIRDKETRRRLEALPFPITMRQPQPHSIKFVNEFSKKTGDYASLSLADIKVLALTYELEVEVQGGNSHLNSEPHKILTEGAATKGRQREEFNDPPEQEEEKEVEKCALREDTETDDTQTHEGLELEPFGEEEGNCASQENGEDSDAAEKNGEESNEKEEDTDDDDDGGGWITCENIKKHKGKRNIFGTVEEEEEEDKDVQVACITGDFAMQNVLKHIGLSVMGVDGHLIKQLKTYILRCHACFRTTSAMDKIFCPHCGNKTLKKVSVTLDPDGTQRIWINTKRPINKKGMKYSLPTPKGGKHARNPILVADQREAKKFSSKMSRKKINPLHEDYNPADQTPFAVRDVYSRAAQLGYIGGKNHHHFYWEKRNPNEPQRRTGKK